MKKPVKPRLPKKPTKPPKTLPHFKELGFVFYDRDITLKDVLKDAANVFGCDPKDLDLEQVRIAFHGRMAIGERERVDNPQYPYLKKEYDRKMARYKKRMLEYPVRMKLYETTMPVYEAWKLSLQQDAKMEQLKALQSEIDAMEQEKEKLLSEAGSLESEAKKMLESANETT